MCAVSAALRATARGPQRTAFRSPAPGLRQQLERCRSGRAAGSHDRTDRTFGPTGCDRRRRRQPFLTVDPVRALRRRRLVEGQYLSRHVFTQSLRQLPVVHDPVRPLGDQVHQYEDRVYTGGGVSRTFDGTLFDRPSETVLGVQTRYDGISHGLTNAFRGSFCPTPSSTTLVRAMSGSMRRTRYVGPIGSGPRSACAGTPRDVGQFDVAAGQLGHPDATLSQPKIHRALGPFYKTELFVGAGMGYHSNDARAVIRTQVPGDPSTSQAHRRSWCARRGRRSGSALRPCPISIARSACSTCIRIPNCSSMVTPERPYPARPAYAPKSRSRTTTSRCRGCASMPIWR